jgi:2-polyprenyl-3-methyl-5-hydroxy-6-metoxy-1,4-benzoquinol methylase
MPDVTELTVRQRFEEEAQHGRRLLPDPSTVAGMGTFAKYARAADLMAGESVREVLDVGCNRGSVEALFHGLHAGKASNVRVEGIDISHAAIEQAKSLGLTGCSFTVYDGKRIPFPDTRFDLVIMVEVLEHVIDKVGLLREVARVLRPGGTLFLTTPNPDSLALRLETGLWKMLRAVFRRPQPAKDIFAGHDELAGMLREAGFEIPAGTRLYWWPHAFLGFEGWSLFPPLPPSLLYRYQAWCVRRAERVHLPEPLDRRVKWSLLAEVRRGGAHQPAER